MPGDPAEADEAAARSHPQSVPGIASDGLLRRFANSLIARGMEIRKYGHGEEVIEIAVVNPRDPDRGRTVIGYDGLLTWEYQNALKVDSDIDKCADIICALLGKNVAQIGSIICHSKGNNEHVR